MNTNDTIAILTAIAPIVGNIPVVGAPLGAMVGAATQVCQVAENARANKKAYEQLANEVAGYASAVSEAVQAGSAEYLPDAENVSDPQRERTIMIDDLRTVFEEVAATMTQKRIKDNNRGAKLFGKLRRLGYDLLHQDDDKSRLQELRDKVKSKVESFHIGVDIRGLNELQTIRTNMVDMAANHASSLERIQAEMRAIEARRVQELQQDRIRQEQDAEERNREKLAEEARRAEERREDRLRQDHKAEEEKREKEAQEAQRAKERQEDLLRRELKDRLKEEEEARQSEERKQKQLVKDRKFMKEMLSPVLTARFDGKGEPQGCLPGTREQLLEQITIWIYGESSPDIFCLTGLAGTGKTTIAESVCINFSSKPSLASFFLSRSSADRQSPERILQTIVYQLGVQQVAMGTTISDAFRNDLDLTTRPISHQVSRLFVEPIETLQTRESPVLLVIDALDECKMVDGVEGGKLIPLLASAVRQASGRVKLLVTSREEPEIMRMFDEISIRNPESLVQLHKIEDSVVEGDIKIFYRHHFDIIANRIGLADISSWPTREDFDLLVRLTGKLFVYAALVSRILSAKRVDPERRLEEILRPTIPFSNSSERYKDLDDLYLGALEKAVTVDEMPGDDELVERVHLLVGALVVLQSPLNLHTLSELLDIKPLLIKEDVENLSAVLLVPEHPDDPVTIFHKSFTDFVVGRCSDQRFHINTEEYHAHILRRCLRIMNTHLKRDICNIKDPSLLNEEVEDLEEKRKQFLPYKLRYACEYWTAHLSFSGKLEESVAKDLAAFCEEHLFHWLEVLSLLGKVSFIHKSLPAAIKWCNEYADSSIVIARLLLQDVERVVQAYEFVIRISALQLYSSVPIFMPESSLYKRIKSESRSPLELVSARPDNWPPKHRVFEGHADMVGAVMFSPDGTRIVSGSCDKTVRVWDTITGQIVMQLEGHTAAVFSVAFSADGTRIASCSADKTIRLWNSNTGCLVAQLDGHTDVVRSVAFSSDGKHVASGSDDHTIRVWDSNTGCIVSQLEGHTDVVYSVAFSPDGTYIVSGSDDKTLILWDVAKGEKIMASNQHSSSFLTATFSHDGSYILSGSFDNTVGVWDTSTCNEVTKLEGHFGAVASVVFSHDGSYILSGSEDRTIRLWDAATGKAITRFDGHSNEVRSVAFSPDGTHIASASLDGTVRVWDITAIDEVLTRPEGHEAYVTSIAISSDEATILSGSGDMTVGVWDATKGKLIARLRGHTGVVKSVAFSPDGTQIASGSKDATILLRNNTTGSLARLSGHSSCTISLAFAPDGKSLASGSCDKTVKTWDMTTETIKTFTGHFGKVTSIAFSPDGKWIASASCDWTLRVWDTTTCEVIAGVGDSHWGPKFLAFSEDGRHITSVEEFGDQKTYDFSQHDCPTHGLEVSLTQCHSPPLNLAPRPGLSTPFPALGFRLNSDWLCTYSSPESNPRRLCWIPPDRRGAYQVFGSLAVFGDGSGGITILRAYMDA